MPLAVQPVMTVVALCHGHPCCKFYTGAYAGPLCAVLILSPCEISRCHRGAFGVFAVLFFFNPTLISSFGTAYRPFSYCIPSCFWAIIVVSSRWGFWLDLGMRYTCLQILPYTLLYNILVTWILCFVDRASRYNSVNKNQLDAQLIFSTFRQPLHVSGVSRPIIRRYNGM